MTSDIHIMPATIRRSKVLRRAFGCNCMAEIAYARKTQFSDTRLHS